MKQADIKIGSTYMCYIGTSLAHVVVTGRVEGYVIAGRRVSDRFTVRRVGEDKDLPKARTAAALRPSSDRRVWCKNPTPTVGDTGLPARTPTPKL
jgi:hypothetical protein